MTRQVNSKPVRVIRGKINVNSNIMKKDTGYFVIYKGIEYCFRKIGKSVKMYEFEEHSQKAILVNNRTISSTNGENIAWSINI